jgi:hypothetical protein
MRRSIVALAFLAACGSEASQDGAAPAASNIPRAAPSARGADYQPPSLVGGGGSATSSGVKVCDDYLAAVKRCARTMGPDGAKVMEDAAEQMRAAMEAAPSSSKQVFLDACEQAQEAIDRACP